MRKRISLLIAALMLALTMSMGGAGAAFAAPPSEDEQPNGNCGPHKNPPPGLVCVKGEGKTHMETKGQR